MKANDLVKNIIKSNRTKTKRSKNKEGKKIVYLLHFTLVDGVNIVKIGITTRDIYDRVVEILLSFYHQYRYFPQCKPIKFSQNDNYFKIESSLHRYFKPFKWNSEHSFDGSNEMFMIDPDVAKTAYQDIMNGIVIEDYNIYPTSEELCSVIELEKYVKDEESNELPDGFLSDIELETRSNTWNELTKNVNIKWYRHLL